jgi:peptide chain release factor 1
VFLLCSIAVSKLPLADIIHRYHEVNEKLSKVTDTKEMITLGRQQKSLQTQFDLASELLQLEKAIDENSELLNIETDSELREMAETDNHEKTTRLNSLENELLTFLAPSDPRDDNDILLEMRAGAGGDESSLFVGEMLRMYSYMSTECGLSLNIISSSANETGGYKEVICEIHGHGAFSKFKYEGGVHRVQRVPATEKQGRIHTSTISVAVMPLIEGDNDFKLDMKEVEVVASTSTGAGGQSVNTTYSAIKAKHLPTGIEAQSQDERNQAQNRVRALQVLTSRVYDHFEQIRLEKESTERKDQVGKADRSEKIRTYNFPQDRLTDHRYNTNWNQLPLIMDGGIKRVIDEIKQLEAQRILESLNS